MTKAELIEKNVKLRDIDAIITKRADRKANREQVYNLVMANFGESASLEDIKDLLEYYDIMTNDATMVGSKLFDSTLFEPIKELAIAYKEEVSQLSEKLEQSGKKEEILKRIVANQHVNYTVVKNSAARTEELEKENARLNSLLEYVSLSDRQKAERVLSAEDTAKRATAQAEASKKGAEKVLATSLATSKELKDINEALEKELAAKNEELTDVNNANKELRGQNQKLKNQVSQLSHIKKGWKIGHLVSGAAVIALAVSLGITIPVLVSNYESRLEQKDHEAETLKNDLRELAKNSYQTASNNLEYVEHVYEMAKEAIDKANAVLSDPTIPATDERVAEAMNVLATLQTTVDELKAQNASDKQKVDAELDKMNSDKKYVPSARDALDIVENAAKTLDETNQIVEEVLDAVELAKTIAKEVLTAENDELKADKETLEQANAELTEAVNTLQAEKDELSDRVNQLAAENEELQNKVDELAAENEELVANDITLFNYIFEQAKYEVSDWYVEDGKITTFTAKGEGYEAIALSQEGLDAYDAYTAEGTNALTVAGHLESYSDSYNLAKYLIEEMAQAYNQNEQETQVVGNEDKPSEVADENDEGKTPTEPAGGEPLDTPTPHLDDDEPEEQQPEEVADNEEEQNSNEQTSSEVSNSNENQDDEKEDDKYTWGQD